MLAIVQLVQQWLGEVTPAPTPAYLITTRAEAIAALRAILAFLESEP